MAFTDEQNRLICRNLIAKCGAAALPLGCERPLWSNWQMLSESQRFVLQVFDSKELLFFAMLEDIHTESALRRRRTPCRRMRLCFLLTAQLRQFWQSAGGSPGKKPSCSSKMTRSFSCTDCRRRSKRLTTTMTRRTSAHCWKRAVCAKGRMALAAATVRGSF